MTVDRDVGWSPFARRPWMTRTGAAKDEGHKGITVDREVGRSPIVRRPWMARTGAEMGEEGEKGLNGIMVDHDVGWSLFLQRPWMAHMRSAKGEERGKGHKGITVDREVEGSPFLRRPWMARTGAAKGEEGGKGLKGIVAGATTGALEITITYPTEFIKTQLQLDKGKEKQYKGVVDVVVKTVKTKGFFGLYRGLSVLVYGSAPKAAVRFGTFEKLKEYAMDSKGNLTPLNRMLCGLGAGINEAILAVTPMETIKTKFIHDHRSAKPKFKGFLHGVREIVKSDGLSGLYKGLTATILRQGSNQAIRFFVVESLKDMYRKGDPTVTVPKWLTAIMGSVAGAASVFGNAPIDVLKTRMQGMDAHKYKSTWDCAKQLQKEGGLKAFYKGTVPRLLRVCLDVGITFTIYDTIMEIFNKTWP